MKMRTNSQISYAIVIASLCGVILCSVGSTSVFAQQKENSKSKVEEKSKKESKQESEKESKSPAKGAKKEKATNKKSSESGESESKAKAQRDGTKRDKDDAEKAKMERERDGAELGVMVAPSPGGSPLVLGVRRGSPADEAGIRHGDYIMSIDGTKIKSPEKLRKVMSQKASSDAAKITLWRGGEEVKSQIDFARDTAVGQADLENQAWLGAMIRPGREGGVEIARIYLNSPAHRSGLMPGDQIVRIEDKKISTPEAVTKCIQQAKPGNELEMSVKRGDEQVKIVVELGNLEDFHERLFGKRFRPKFDDFHEMLDPDFDGVTQRVVAFRVPVQSDDQTPLRDLLSAMRDELREFREEVRSAEAKQDGSSNKKNGDSTGGDK